MGLEPAAAAAYDRVADRAADARAAFTPGAASRFDDVAATAATDRPALDPLCVAPPGDAYFVASGDEGRRIFTRDGALTVRDGVVTGADARPMMGYTTPSGPLAAIRIDPVDAALGRPQNVRVDSGGQVLYDRRTVDPRTGASALETVVAGRLALARFPAATRLTPVGLRYGAAPDGVVAHYGRPGDGTFEAVAPMHRRNSGTDVDAALARLNDAYLAFDAMQAAARVQNHTAKTAMDLVK